MHHLPFVWEGPTPLAAELAAPVCRASVRRAAHGRPVSLTLWRRNGSGLRIQSRMHDLPRRGELAVLEFDLVTRPQPDDHTSELSAGLGTALRVEKMLVFEAGACAEAGVFLRGGNGTQLIAVAGAAPFTLAVKGVEDDAPHGFEPAFLLEQYLRVEVQ